MISRVKSLVQEALTPLPIFSGSEKGAFSYQHFNTNPAIETVEPLLPKGIGHPRNSPFELHIVKSLELAILPTLKTHRISSDHLSATCWPHVPWLNFIPHFPSLFRRRFTLTFLTSQQFLFCWYTWNPH